MTVINVLVTEKKNTLISHVTLFFWSTAFDRWREKHVIAGVGQITAKMATGAW